MNFQGRRYKTGEVIYSEWFERGGDNAVFMAEKVDSSGTTTVLFNIYTKNSDDNTDGTIVKDSGGTDYDLSITSTDTDVKKLVIESTTTSGQGFKELLRLKATVTGGDWLLGRFFPPTFYDAAT